MMILLRNWQLLQKYHKALQDRIASTPRRSSSTAVDLHNEIRCTKEDELTKLVETQKKMIEEINQASNELLEHLD